MLHIRALSKQYGGKVLFQNADFHLGYRSKAALVGPNGAGKSTLTKIILGLEGADTGTITRASHLSIGHLPQELPKMGGRTVLEETLRMDGRLEDLEAAKRELEAEFADPEKGSPSEEALAHYGRVLEELDHLDAYRLESRAKAILSGMGFKDSDLARPLTEFSGGWLMRVALSRILLMDPDLLLLDEPTNHLDLESLLWLEEFLRRYQGALLLISHDTAFLNRMVNEVIEIDQKTLVSYRGDLDAYRVQKEERLTLLRAQYAGQQTKIAELENFIRRFGAKASKATQAQSRQKQLDKMERIELPEDRDTVGFRFPPAPHSGKEVITVREADIGYGEKTVLKNLDWVIRRGTRTAIVGVNGAGKTTLLKVLSGKLSPQRGLLKFGHEVRTGYYAQMQAETLGPDNTILQELESTAPDWPVAKVRAIAGAFLFTGDDVNKRCKVLSGGEKARVALAKLLLEPSNFLILDEPTNHLDVESRGVLLEALEKYEGTLCLVSHDREFVSPLVDQVLEIVPGADGARVDHLVGSYDDYLERKLKEAAGRVALSGAGTDAKAKDGKTVETPGAKPSAPSTNKLRAWRTEKEKVEAEIAKLEWEQSGLRDELAKDSTYEDAKKTMELVEKQRVVGERLQALYARWEELEGFLSG